MNTRLTNFSACCLGNFCARQSGQAFRCLEMSGVSKFCKTELATLAKTCVEAVRQAGLEGSDLAFRRPVMAAPAPHQPGAMPPPETVWQSWEGFETTCQNLATACIIIKWLRKKSLTQRIDRLCALPGTSTTTGSWGPERPRG